MNPNICAYFFLFSLSVASCCCKFSTIILGCTFCFRHRVVCDESVSKSVRTHTGNDIPVQSYCVLCAGERCWICCRSDSSLLLSFSFTQPLVWLVVVCETFVGFDNVLPKYSWPQPTWEPKFCTKCQTENCRYQAQQENNSTHTPHRTEYERRQKMGNESSSAKTKLYWLHLILFIIQKDHNEGVLETIRT